MRKYSTTGVWQRLSKSSRKRDLNCYVTEQDCDGRHTKIDLALFGADGRGGMVKDVADIKMKLEVTTSIMRTIVLPVLLPLMVGGIAFLIGRYWK